ncbi:hypothetical protein T069G_02929 [Trichoderma breve]|uniref:FAD-binding domain-containing protein n=1 Tax=Trichoderma breve TaxID=2034170 RepID=A0A9W9BKH0_9HYPO|nr:hypothetical protein T069G_02929 [Trichoderma breve]KAJ4861975.1 hypothetical protein T069G_02929 [Trichoderma breve]
MPQTPIRIIGAGIGGLTLGRCLLKYGIPAVLYERKPSSPCHDYGITLHAPSYLPLLDILRIDEFTFRRRMAVDGLLSGGGNIEPGFFATPKRINSTSFRAHRGKFEKLLCEGLDIQWGNSLEKVEEAPSGMILHMQNGQKLESTCIIGADGPHSITRKSLSPNTSFNVLPYVAFNGARHVKRELYNSVYAPAFNGSIVIRKKQGDKLLNLFVNEQQEDAVSISWTFSRPARSSIDPLHRPNRPVSEATNIPKEFFDEIEQLHGLDQPFKGVFDIERLQKERVLHWLMRTVLVSHQELCTLANKGVFFIGDSVHAEPILGGEGANNAIIDGMELAKCISKFGQGGIATWYDSRYPAWKDGIGKSEQAIALMHR